MKVKELIEHLQKLDQDLEVYTAKDAESNGYNSVYYEPGVLWARGDKDYDIEVCGEEDLESEYDEDERKEFRQIVVI